MSDSSEKKGNIIIITAPSGAGKTTLLAAVKQDFPELKESVSCTTRKPRPGEIDGEAYFFIDEGAFRDKIANGDFLEWENVHGNLYGTERSFVQDGFARGETLIFDLDVKGAENFRKIFPESRSIFIMPPDAEVLEKRLRARATESEEAIKNRVQNSIAELRKSDSFDYKLVNEDLDQAVKDLTKIIREIMAR